MRISSPAACSSTIGAAPITESESTLFSTLTLHFNPHYFNAEYARAHGHPGIVVNPMLVFTTVFGLTVEDLSEGGGPFLGVNELTYHQPVYPGDSLGPNRTCSTGASRTPTRASGSSPGTPRASTSAKSSPSTSSAPTSSVSGTP